MELPDGLHANTEFGSRDIVDEEKIVFALLKCPITVGTVDIVGLSADVTEVHVVGVDVSPTVRRCSKVNGVIVFRNDT